MRLGRLLSWQPLSRLFLLPINPILIFAIFSISVGCAAATYIMTEGFAQYLLNTGRLVRQHNGNLDSGKGYLFRFDYQPPLLFVLRSDVGDADIYVSSYGRSPTPDDYDLKSENFSLDLVFVSEELKPPISVLIYASPQSSDNSTFLLELYKHDTLLDEYSRIRNQIESQSGGSVDDYDDFMSGAFDSRRQNSIFTSQSDNNNNDNNGQSETLGSLLYQLLVRLGRLLLFILEVAADA
ncbi:hypothetical protein BOX15_Mlig007636g1 [Macrostomum lignano]|uniref:Uncharacterized protein n=1 Tax=Macrostomum lignano TaxID=282301 RepID=A0A267GZW8_9PLAT|nr:hypothetical protein BOX15_Mlig007636g1 [Macrostomum lignano]